MLDLRLYQDPNGILMKQPLSCNSSIKRVRGTQLEQLYCLMPRDEEYELHQSSQTGNDSKLMIKY